MEDLKKEIKERLQEFELEPTERRLVQVESVYRWNIMLVYRFKRVKNTKLAKKMIDENKVLRYTDNWIYIRNY